MGTFLQGKELSLQNKDLNYRANPDKMSSIRGTFKQALVQVTIKTAIMFYTAIQQAGLKPLEKNEKNATLMHTK